MTKVLFFLLQASFTGSKLNFDVMPFEKKFGIEKFADK